MNLQNIYIQASVIQEYQENIVKLAREIMGDMAEEFIQQFDELDSQLNFANPEYEGYYWTDTDKLIVIKTLLQEAI